MVPTRTASLIAMLVIAAGFAFGQLPISGGGGSGIGITSGTSGAVTFASGVLTQMCDSRGMCWLAPSFSGIPTEIRPAAKKLVSQAQVRASAAVLRADQVAPKSYLQLARAIKMNTAATDEARITQALDELKTKVYDFAKVDSYLYHQALKQGANVRWVWKPMRENDTDAINGYKNGGITYRDKPTSGYVIPTLYAHEIPERVLARAASILDKIPDATLLISDYEAVKPDPFLAISTPKLLAEGKIWIVDMWNEPTFDDGFEKTIESVHSIIQFHSVTQ